MTRAGAERELEELMERWAELVERGDAAAVAEVCTGDAVILASDAPTARGRPAITQLVQSWIDAGESNDRSSTIDAWMSSARGRRAAVQPQTGQSTMGACVQLTRALPVKPRFTSGPSGG